MTGTRHNALLTQPAVRCWTHFDDVGEVLSAHEIVGLNEDLAQPTLSHRVVLGVELVEPMKRVAVLQQPASLTRLLKLIIYRCNNFYTFPFNLFSQ